MMPVERRGAKPSPAGATLYRYYACAFKQLNLFRQLALAGTARPKQTSHSPCILVLIRDALFANQVGWIPLLSPVLLGLILVVHNLTTMARPLDMLLPSGEWLGPLAGTTKSTASS
jgi:hypothetical protein